MKNNNEIYEKMILELDVINQMADERHEEIKQIFATLFDAIEAITGEK